MLSVYLTLNVPYLPLWNTELGLPMAVTNPSKLVKIELIAANTFSLLPLFVNNIVILPIL